MAGAAKGWLPNDLNYGRMDLFFLLLACTLSHPSAIMPEAHGSCPGRPRWQPSARVARLHAGRTCKAFVLRKPRLAPTANEEFCDPGAGMMVVNLALFMWVASNYEYKALPKPRVAAPKRGVAPRWVRPQIVTGVVAPRVRRSLTSADRSATGLAESEGGEEPSVSLRSCPVTDTCHWGSRIKSVGQRPFQISCRQRAAPTAAVSASISSAEPRCLESGSQGASTHAL